MKKSSYLPATFLLAALVLSGAVIANAQDALPGDTATLTQADFRGEHGPRGDHGPGGARGMGGMFRQIMAEVDADGDGAITQAEIDAYRTAQVTAADASGDGAISLSEFETIFAMATRDRMVDAFQELDADGDGTVTTAEMDTRFGGIVDRMDRNGDGALSADDRGGRGDDERGPRGMNDRG